MVIFSVYNTTYNWPWEIKEMNNFYNIIFLTWIPGSRKKPPKVIMTQGKESQKNTQSQLPGKLSLCLHANFRETIKTLEWLYKQVNF
jgi:hypothetical protein